MQPTKRAKFVFLQRRFARRADECDRNFTPQGIRYSDYGDFRHRRMLKQNIFYLAGIDVLAASNDHILQSTVDSAIALGVHISEVAGMPFSKPLALLQGVKGIEFVKLARPDECCGFGGTFSVTEEPVSVRMGQDKVRDHLQAGAEYIVSGDMSCLMHQQGCAERMKADARFIHIAQVLNGARE